jgi:hypothetical protein
MREGLAFGVKALEDLEELVLGFKRKSLRAFPPHLPLQAVRAPYGEPLFSHLRFPLAIITWLNGNASL